MSASNKPYNNKVFLMSDEPLIGLPSVSINNEEGNLKRQGSNADSAKDSLVDFL